MPESVHIYFANGFGHWALDFGLHPPLPGKYLRNTSPRCAIALSAADPNHSEDIPSPPVPPSSSSLAVRSFLHSAARAAPPDRCAYPLKLLIFRSQRL